MAGSYAVLERNAPQAIRYRTEQELRYLIGTGVSARCVVLREILATAGFEKVKIVAQVDLVQRSVRFFHLQSTS